MKSIHFSVVKCINIVIVTFSCILVLPSRIFVGFSSLFNALGSHFKAWRGVGIQIHSRPNGYPGFLILCHLPYSIPDDSQCLSRHTSSVLLSEALLQGSVLSANQVMVIRHLPYCNCVINLDMGTSKPTLQPPACLHFWPSCVRMLRWLIQFHPRVEGLGLRCSRLSRSASCLHDWSVPSQE